MTTMALGPISQQTIFNAAKDVRGGRRAIRFADTLVGRLLDFSGSTVVSFLNTRLERDVLILRGLCSFVNDADGHTVDPTHEVSRLLIALERSVRTLRALAIKTQANRSLRKTQKAMTKLVEVLDALEGVVMQLKLAITEHDARIVVRTDVPDQLQYVLTDDQMEQLEGCITLERQPTERMMEAARRRATQVVSR